DDGSLIAFNPETEKARLIPSIFHRGESDTKPLFAQDKKNNRLTMISGTKETISVYTLLGNSKWTLTMRIKNVSMDDIKLVCWNVVAYDGKSLVVRERKKDSYHKGWLHVYDMEAKSWRVLGSIWCGLTKNLEYYTFTPSLFFVEEDEQEKVIVASNDLRISYLNAIMALI
ncbi:PREDICTED: putative F-box/kelch-repeat protein At1g20940, partial [Camelina sativa]|uniref:F-box/kelch-repeat protein At1g20940 n=1 Tax=Camelina sativa TaxID=90675 RepID=A0ABM1RH56_CAMSA